MGKEIKNVLQQKLNFMGDDAQFESLVQLINISKPLRIGLLKNINKFMRLAYLAV